MFVCCGGVWAMIWCDFSRAKPSQLGTTERDLKVLASGTSDQVVEGGRPYYPSMDPERLGAKPEVPSPPPPPSTGEGPPKPNWTRPDSDEQPKKKVKKGGNATK
eukprot:TRINITY_DN11957_c0_g1_i1.p1 TRINITY_DN11957_c0_g1~~TRINITY_DN11957_c0_g1_i1.p1  ORF type:complete len:104 (+),score=27.46 TRINITY_DN11957_c0_g1_i1:314-625(+)